MKKNNLLALLLVVAACFQAQAQVFPDEFFDPNNTPPNVNEQDITALTSFLGFPARGKYSVWYGCGENGQQRDHVEKPFIWVEGFDPNIIGNSDLSKNPKHKELYLKLLRHGFDIVQIDFNNNRQYIQRNAQLVVTLLQKLQAEMDNAGSKQEIVIMGVSMGGQIVRYALADMETFNLPHNVRLYISHDSQHFGANVPWGLQQMIQDFTGFGLATVFTGTSSLSAITNIFAGMFDGTGVSGNQIPFQLLRNSPSPIIQGLRLQFEQDLVNRGDYPKKCRMIAIANGANNGIGLAPQGANYQIVAFPFPSIVGLVQRNVMASPGITLSALGVDLGTRIVYSKIVPGLINHSFIGFFPPGLLDFDTAPGGTFLSNSSLLIGALVSTKKFNFTPTTSALGLDVDNPWFNVAAFVPGFGTVPNMPNMAYTFNYPLTEFDAIWANETNSAHADFLEEDEPGLEAFVMSEVSPDNLYIQNKIVLSGEGKIYEAASQVLLGRNITIAFPVGDVVFEDGSKVVIRAGGEVNLYDGCEAPLGSNVDIRENEFYDCQ